MHPESSIKVLYAPKQIPFLIRITKRVGDCLGEGPDHDLLLCLDQGHGTGENTRGCSRGEGGNGNISQMIMIQILVELLLM